MRLEFASLSFGRPGFGLPSAELRNLYVEATPAGPGQSARLPRPGLRLAYTIGVGPDRGRFWQDGVFDGDIFAVSGAKVFRGQSEIGTVDLGGFARFAGNEDQLVVVAAGKAYCYEIDETNTAQFTQIAMPDGKAVADAFTVAGRFYYLIADDDAWYWSELGDAKVVSGLAFATSETSPDANVGAEATAGEVGFFGRTSTEFWLLTGSADLPLAYSRRYGKGCAAQQSIVSIDNSVEWVGHDLKVYRAGAGPERISTHAIEERIRRCATPGGISAFAASVDGHDLYVLTIPGEGSWAFDHATQQWAEWTSRGRATFRGATACTAAATTYIGDEFSGRVFILDPEAFQDDGDAIERLATVIAPGPVECRNVVLECAVGVGPEDGSEPLVEMRYSDDLGRTWSDWDARSLGKAGEYDTLPRWNRLGRITSKGRLFEFRCTDAVLVAFTAAHMNVDDV